MSRFELWFFKRIVKREVLQGDHKHNIEKMYSLIADAARKEFTEDNKPTLDSFLDACFRNSLRE